MKTVKIQATKVREGKKQHLEAGKVYEVSAKMSRDLIANGQAVKVDPKMKVGEVYKAPDQPEKKIQNTPPSITD